MKVFFFPPTSPFNPYIDNIVSGLENNGVTIVNKGAKNKYTKFLSSFKAMAMHTDVYHFNWIENKSAVDNKKNRVICWAILRWIHLMKASGGKLAWTMHNKESHFAEGDKTFHYHFMKKFISEMDMVLVHAKETGALLRDEYKYPEDRICYVPHGSYLNKDSSFTPVNQEHKKFIVLTFGMVNRYKNIPMLIKAFESLEIPDAELRIYGKCDTKDIELKDEIQKLVSSAAHTTYEDRFIPDEEVDAIFAESDVVILPYDKKSMINSGAAIKAFSEGRPIIVSAFGAIKDIQEKSFVHCYDYNSDEEHLLAIKKMIVDVYKKWKEDKSILALEGKEAFEYSQNELSWDTICKTIADFYEKICRS